MFGKVIMTSMGNIVLSFSMMYFQVVVLMTFSSAQPSVNIQTNEADVSHKTLTNFLTNKRRVMLDVEQETFLNDKKIELESDLLSRQFRDVVSETNISLSSHANNTDLDSGQDHEKKYQPDPIMSKGMLKRTFYILVGVMAIIIVYFMVRAIRIRRRKSRTKRYGVILKNDDNLEMAPLDQQDDDEDMTIFEMTDQRR